MDNTPLTRIVYPLLIERGVECILSYSEHVEGSTRDPLHPLILDMLVSKQDVCRCSRPRRGRILVIEKGRSRISEAAAGCPFYIGECPGRTVLTNEEVEEAVRRAGLPYIIVSPVPGSSEEELAVDAVLVLEVVREILWDGQMVFAGITTGLRERFERLAGKHRVRMSRRTPADEAWDMEIYDVIAPIPSNISTSRVPPYTAIFIPLTRRRYTRELVQSMLFWGRPVEIPYRGDVRPHRLLHAILDWVGITGRARRDRFSITP